MKKSFSSYASILFVILPVIISLAWHINNQGWPNDDAAEYMKTAYHQYLVFQDGSLLDGFRALYQIRNWRPTLFPAVATPFLLLFKGNVLAAKGAALITCFLVCQIYIYAIARRYLDSLRASLVAASVGSCTANIFSSLVFFSEIAWLAFFTGFVFHLLKSEFFRKRIQAAIAGIFLGLAALVRPAETAIIAILPLIGMIAMALVRKVFSLKNTAFVMGFVLLSTFLLFASAFEKQIDYRFVLGIGIVIILSQLLLIKADKKDEPGISGLNLFAVSFMIINLLWWAGSMPQLYSWIYDASFGTLARVTDVSIKREGFFSVITHIFFIHLFPNGILAALICLILLLPDAKKNPRNIKRLSILAMITFGLLLPMCCLYLITGTSEPRRVFIGMSFLLMLLSILSLQDGPLRRIRYWGIALVVAMQITGLLLSAKGHVLLFGNSLLTQYYASFKPKIEADQNEAVILRLLELGVPKNSRVAVYTMALFQSRDRIYEPAALSLAALTTGSNLEIIYFWDIADYSAVIKRLRGSSIPFLLVDVYEETENNSRHQPYIQFTAALLAKMKGPYINPPGLQRAAAFKLNGREQVLFKVLPS